uniref:Uncharacterized protein n=1 Tax=Sphaerodactylus townsendi TaxID=933632 RepID=A0ACB8EFJ9_9SAUR
MDTMNSKVVQLMFALITGLYRCVVSIHGLQETSGKGTELQVKRTSELMENSKCLSSTGVSVAQDPIVSQPSSAQGTEGDSITLRCSYNFFSKLKVGSYEWVKNPGLEVKNTSPEFMGRVNCTSDQGFLLEKRADIEIKDLRLYDSGTYRCVVNFHGLQEFSGNGTDLQVTEKAGKLMGIQDAQVPQLVKWDILIEGGTDSNC